MPEHPNVQLSTHSVVFQVPVRGGLAPSGCAPGYTCNLGIGVGETGGNSNTFCFGSSGTETIWDRVWNQLSWRAKSLSSFFSWTFEDRTSDVRVTIRRSCLKSLKMGYTLHIYRSSPIKNPLSWWISDPVQSKSAWTGLDYESSGLIQSIPYFDLRYTPAFHLCANFGYLALFLMQKYLEMSTSSGRNSSAKKWLPMLQSTPDARSIVTAARVNCNILKNNVMISTVIFKNVNCRYGRITCSLTESCGLKQIQVCFARGLLSMSILLIIKLN